MKIKVIIHGRSKNKDKLLLLAKENAEAIEFELTQSAEHAQAIAAKCEGYDLVISCGGDGTNNHVVNGIMNVASDNRPALGFIPAGSGNDFARVYSSGSIDEMIQQCKSSTFGHLDLIKLKCDSLETHVLNMLTCGIGAEIAKTVNARKFKMPAAFNYYTAIIAWLAKYNAPMLEIKFNDELIQSETFLAAMGNGAYAGNGLGLNPQSSADDGMIGLSIIGNVGVVDFLKYQSTLKRCEYVKDHRVSYHKSTEVFIKVLKGTLPIETDGEFCARLNEGEQLCVQILPSVIKVV